MNAIVDKATGEITGLALLRVPFQPNQISKLPKPTISNDKWKELPKGECKECGGYHATSKTIHLSYVGHAALTDRLLNADPAWTWEPVAMGEDGQPKLDSNGGMWIRLTVCGVTRLGYGDAQGKTGGNAVKERIGDALRNAAMRFGAALDLWHKGDLHMDEDDAKDLQERKDKGLPTSTITPTDGARDGWSPEEMKRINKVASDVTDCLAVNNVNAACEVIEDANFEMEELICLWTFFDSKERSAIKKQDAVRRKARETAPA